MVIDAGNYLWKVHSTVMVPENSKVGLSVVPFNIHVMKLTDDELTGDEL